MADSENEYMSSRDAAKHFKKLTECDQGDGHEDDNAEWRRIASDPHTKTQQDYQQCDED